MISRNSLQDKLFLQPETVSLFLQDSSSRLASISFDSKLCLYRYRQIFNNHKTCSKSLMGQHFEQESSKFQTVVGQKYHQLDIGHKVSRKDSQKLINCHISFEVTCDNTGLI